MLAAALSIAACDLAAPPKGVLTIGTTYYIDSLNPFVGIEPQSDTAYGMIFPQLVQYGPGLRMEGDWAKSWTLSDDGRRWTFHLRGDGRWSDGVPLTAQDGAWTLDTILRFESGATSYYAGTLQGLLHAYAPNPDTLVLQYSRAEPTVLANLEQVYILPEHIWDSYTGDDGNDLKSFVPNAHYPVVSGGPYYITQYEEKGTTVFRPNPYFYGPKSHAKAVTLTYYTNATSMLADLEAGELDFVDDVPYTIANRLVGVHIDFEPGNEVTNLGFNSNPLKPKNRELLNPLVKEAFEYAIPRRKLIDVVFGGHAIPWANIMSSFSIPSGWVNPAVKPLPYDPARANAILNGLGYKVGPGGVRVVPATPGRFAQPAHQMSYTIIVPDDLDFDGDLQFEILATAFAKIGVKVTEVPGGDASEAYTLITGPNYKYLSTDMYTWYWHPYIDPDFNLSVVTKAQWGDNSDTGFDDPLYDGWWAAQGNLTSFPQRQSLVWKMEAYLAQKRPYIQLVNPDLITAHTSGWTGFEPTLWTYSKLYYTNPRPTS